MQSYDLKFPMGELKMKSIMKHIVSYFVLTIILIGMAFPCLLHAQERVSVNAGVANMRAGAGTKNQVLWQVEKYHPFIVLEKNDKWIKVKDFENDVAWIHNSLVGKEKSVITIKEKCNIRSKPTTKSSILFTAERGVPFRLISTKGTWLKVEHADGDIGWIFKSLVW